MVSILAKVGYRSTSEFLIKLALPTMGVTLLMFFILIFFFNLPYYVPYAVLFIGLAFIPMYPYLLYERIKINVQERILLFITFAGTISTIDLDRTTFFKKIIEKQEFGYISKITEKILYFAKQWNLGFAVTCRQLAALCPSKIFADFLDRMAVALDFGEPLQVFLSEEQDAVMDDYTNEYEQSLNNIGMLRETFIAITISLAFGMATALLLPLLMGISILVAVKYCLLFIFIVDIFLLIILQAFIPNDDLCHNLKIKDKGTKLLYKSMYYTIPGTIVFGALIFLFTPIPFLMKVAFTATPLTIIGYYAVKEENEVFKRDKVFPAFVRTLGGTISARQASVTSSLGSLRVHDFGSLQPMLESLYKRLKMGSDKAKSWYYFAGETGSKLIHYFSQIFFESVYMGGDARKIGEIISKNFLRLLSLRKLRIQQAAALKGALYGSLVGFVSTVYISVSISSLLAGMFGGMYDGATSSSDLGGLVSSVIPAMQAIDMDLVNVYLGIIIIVHAFISALAIKIVDGGNRYAFFIDFAMMLWLGALVAWLVPIMGEKLMPGPDPATIDRAEDLEGVYLLIGLSFTQVKGLFKREKDPKKRKKARVLMRPDPAVSKRVIDKAHDNEDYPCDDRHPSSSLITWVVFKEVDEAETQGECRKTCPYVGKGAAFVC